MHSGIAVVQRESMLGLTDRDAIGMPVSSTGPIPENFIKRSSRVAEVMGNVAETPLCIPPLDDPTERDKR